MKYLLFNPISGSGESKSQAEVYSKKLEESKLLDMTKIVCYKDFVETLDAGDEIYIFGGDGTLNRFVNGIGEAALSNSVYYFPTGTGNDFSIDVNKAQVSEPYLINEYIKQLPTVTVKGETYKFINGVGYGIDGYCCEIGDKLKLENKVPNYTAIAIKGLLFSFKPREATVTVDGNEMHFKKVWIAPTMFGSHYGGGMIPTPDQKRDAEDKKVSVMVFHGSGKLKTLMIFPSIFKGAHVKNKDCVAVYSGKNITVRFDRPTPLQIDGETLLDVTEYSVSV